MTEINEPIRILSAILLIAIIVVLKKIKIGNTGKYRSTPQRLKDIRIPIRKKKQVVFFRNEVVLIFDIKDIILPKVIINKLLFEKFE
jgi:hypothetical protein